MLEPTSRIVVKQLAPDDWREYRDLRLAALADAPYAFGSTLEREQGFSEADYRERLETRAMFAARIEDQFVGLIGGMVTDEPETADLVSMWVHPSARGKGAGDLLVRAVLDWARDQGCDRVHLWVSEGNAFAERLYARHGFVRTDEVHPIRPEDPTRLEFAMVCQLCKP